jgi:ribosome biogenesis GTPase
MRMKVKGRIIKLTGGLYTVMTEHGRIEARPRGLFRHHNQAPKVGDFVLCEDQTIVDLEERFNDLDRPAIANVDLALLLNAATQPDFSFNLLDRFLVMIESHQVQAVIIVPKIDLLDTHALKALKKDLTYYEAYYPVYYVSKHDAATTEPIKALLTDKVSVLAGQTGAGKSSLMNVLDPTLDLQIGEISKALGRGRHTTRHTELWPLAGGWLADTPGFSKLTFDHLEADDLTTYYPDFMALSSQCKFRGCQHLNEPHCAVKKAVEEGLILESRLQNYRLMHQELKDVKRY